MSIKGNIEKVREKIEEYCNAAGVDAGAVELIGVSKTVGADKVEEAYRAGLRMFGENRVQEFLEKSEILEKDVKWNLIGRLQTNKVKYIMEYNVFLVHSLDRLSLAHELQKQGEKKEIITNALVQFNLSGEDTKSGLPEEEADAFMEQVLKMGRICIKGMMTIGPNTDDEKEIRRVFARAKALFDRLRAEYEGFEYLSMGMSQDFGLAILEGSNMVRVGTAIFGERNYGTA